MSTTAIIVMYLTGGLVMLAFIKLVCHFTLAENFQAELDTSKHQLTSLLRCLVLYSQWFMLVGSLNIYWPAPIAYMLTAMGYIWAPSTPETLSIDCLLTNNGYVPVAVQRVLFYGGVPVVMFLLLILLELVLSIVKRVRSTAAASMAERLGGSAMVVAFFVLPGVLRVVFGLFACVPLDEPVVAHYTAAAVGSYWVHDVSTVCFGTGWHRSLSLGLGVPLVLLLCIGLPVAIVFVTVSNRKRITHPTFQQHWGFLTRAYTTRFCWWEAVIVCQTIALVAVSTFRINMGPFYQTVLMTAVLGIHLYLLIAAEPYVHLQTGRSMRLAVQCLLLTSFVGLTFQQTSRSTAGSDNQPAAEYGIALGALLLFMNVGFICYVLWQLAKQVDWTALASRVKTGRQIVQAWAGQTCAGAAHCAGVMDYKDVGHAGHPARARHGRGGPPQEHRVPVGPPQEARCRGPPSLG
jgi:hypothetical protein